LHAPSYWCVDNSQTPGGIYAFPTKIQKPVSRLRSQQKAGWKPGL
jgi:hypothetical protein